MDSQSTQDVIASTGITRTGYSFNTITLTQGTAQELTAILEKKVAPYSEVYENTPLVIDVSNLNYLVDLEYDRLKEVCSSYKLHLLGVSGIHNEERAETLKKRNIPVVNSVKFARMREENFKPRIITKTLLGEAYAGSPKD